MENFITLLITLSRLYVLFVTSSCYMFESLGKLLWGPEILKMC